MPTIIKWYLNKYTLKKGTILYYILNNTGHNDRHISFLYVYCILCHLKCHDNVNIPTKSGNMIFLPVYGSALQKLIAQTGE